MAARLLKVMHPELARKNVSFSNIWRLFGTKSESVVYSEHGDPEKVLRLENAETGEFGRNSVSVRMLAAPINPADINQIQGTYPLKPSLPAVGGNEGVGEVIETGKDVQNLNTGDQVILRSDQCLGSWCRHLVVSEDQVLKIPNGLPVEAAATVSVNPCTAFRLLKDFEDLQPGDTVIQNGANSSVGQALIQIAAAWSLITVNIIRSRPNVEELKNHLKDLGANFVITEEDLKSPEMKEIVKNIKRPKLALNCVGGKSSMSLFRYLAPKGTMVTYGGMSRQPVTVPTGSLIFDDVNVRGFWMSKWNAEHQKDAIKLNMVEEVCQLVQNGQLASPPCTKHALKDFKTAISEALRPYSETKQLLIMTE